MVDAEGLQVVTTALEPISSATGQSACPLCGGAGSRLFNVSSYWIQRCESCAHQFAAITIDDRDQHITQVYGDDYFFSQGKAGYSDYSSEERLLLHRGRWYARLIAKHCGPGLML